MIYLCGGIHGLSDEQCKGWRNDAKERLGLVLDPLRRDYRGSEDKHFKEIVLLDLKDIMDCSAVLVNAERASWGTAMEIVYAHQNAKPIVAFCSGSISPWLMFHCSHVVRTFDEAIRIIAAQPERKTL